MNQAFVKRARLGYITPGQRGITLGTLEHAILTDQSIRMAQKEMALARLRRETAMYPKDTPLDPLLPKLGGGILGYLIAMYFGLSPVGQIVASVAGYGLGGLAGKYYS